jgi:hypothetical protein
LRAKGTYLRQSAYLLLPPVFQPVAFARNLAYKELSDG